MNTSETKPPQSRSLERVKTDAAFRVLLCLFAIVVLVFAAVPIANALLPGKSIKDNELWYETGQRMLHGSAIYPANAKFPFMYPPAAAVMLVPFSLLGRTGLVIAFVLLTAAAWVASIMMSARLTSGDWRRQHLLLYALPSLIVIVYVWSNFHIGQPSLVLLALMLGGFIALQTRREGLAGALFAIAAGIKAFPFIIIAYLLWRRHWIATAVLVLTLAFLVLVLPMPFRGIKEARADLGRWSEGMLKYDQGGIAQRPLRSNSWKNQSIFGLANRMLRPIDAFDEYNAHTPVYVNFADLSFRTVNHLIVGAGFFLGAIYLAVMPRRRDRTRATDAIEFALFILLLLMFTPLSYGYLFACLLFPLTVVVARLLQNSTGPLLICAALALLLLALTLPFQKEAQLYGNTFFATFSLFIGLALEMQRVKRRKALTWPAHDHL